MSNVFGLSETINSWVIKFYSLQDFIRHLLKLCLRVMLGSENVLNFAPFKPESLFN